MSYYKIIFFLLFFLISNAESQSFSTLQRRNTRVRDAYNEKESLLRENLRKSNLSFSNLNILFIAYKEQSDLELWVKGRTEKNYRLLTTYKICSSSGELGPKRMEGDLQVPEGFYYINNFNPNSNFHLSLGINYPNQSDLILSSHKNPGSAIYIHGSCVTIGCLPMTTDKIKEIYIYAVESKNNGQTKIPVYIFPSRMDSTNYKNLTNKFKSDESLLTFWRNLKTGYDKFFSTKEEFKVTVNSKGEYLFK